MNRTTALILILLSGAVFYTFTSKQYGEAQALAAEASEYRSVIGNVSRIAEARDNLLSSYETIPQSEKDRLMKVLPDNVDAVGLARDLDTIASRYGISIKSVQIEDQATTDPSTIVLPEYALPYDKALVSFSFVSTYSNFEKFLGDLEKSLRIMDVKDASFQTGETGLYEHRITVETYWLK
ncbi:type 4a pilus biogenesis protein PilO [Candidatus Parcubacteria bacterium]|nr:type 4a pilus biogenesis protein PilO [Candidatus Parcubacteria bacterium]